ncbi:hypothetical protein [Halorussus sp. AFM4]|uniref:hypothetical protein n=1 Tax=Halorussus sp. AFM4 TaxID=3421651 RepID=UPI003EBB23DE
MSRTAGDGPTGAGAPTPGGGDPDAAEFERLRARKKERQGNAESAAVRDVTVGEDRVVLTLGFDWTADTDRLAYDLDDDRDVLRLEALAESRGFAFEQVSFLEGETLDVVYTGGEWVPEAHLAHAEGEGSVRETFRAELRLLGRELARLPTALRRLVRVARTMTAKQAIIAVVLVKKLIVIALVAWLVL